MDQGKLTRILKSMEEHEVPQMIVSDPVAIFYLTGKWIFPGERLLALYLNVNGNHKMMINKLFPQESDLGVDIIYYDDIEDGVEILSKYVDKDKTMGIDKTWPSKFLIRLQELGGGSKFVNGSPIIDYIRMVKDEKEQDLMRKSSKINDIAMDKIIPWVAKGLTEKELNAKMREIYKELGCEDVSFDPITAYGHGAADPHHVTDDSKGKRGDCVILDIGGFKDNYASLSDQDDTKESLEELKDLVSTAGAETVGMVIQNREQQHPGTYVGKGKIEELKSMIWELRATGIVCDDELSPAQMKNLQDELDVKVMDRTLIILDIFAARASTSEGKIQVELAQLKYQQTRLAGFGKAMSRLGGGIGTRGPGEKKLEMDRRLIKSRIAQLNRELKDVKKHIQQKIKHYLESYKVDFLKI